MNRDPLSDIQARFRKIPFHDSKLVEVQIARGIGTSDDVALEILMRDTSAPYRLTFTAAAVFEARLDLDAKRVCGDDIAAGECLLRSPWMDSIEQANPHDTPLQGFAHFIVQLIHPGGKINVLARDFQFLPDDGQSVTGRLQTK